VKRTEIAVRGAPPSEALRLEVNGSPGEEGLSLEFLHDERQSGTLARVLGGRVGLGEISVPVAIKLQRDIALSQEDRGSVAAKFDKERNVHRRLQDQADRSSGNERIVRQLEVWKGPADHEADSVEPCILCARGRHGLAPRCPECKDPAAVLEELELTDDRGLRCSRCHRQFWSTPKTRDAILEATLRHDPACRGCELQRGGDPEACRRSAVFLNFFRDRVLLLERLDLDLEDYLRWRRDGHPAGTRQAAWESFEGHRRLLQERRDRLPGPSVRKIADLLWVADLFADVLAGVEHLHEHGVAHLDLKLANVCVRFRGPDLEVKIIDLGLSDDPHTLAYLRQAEGPLSLWTDYSAPEFRRPRPHPVAVDGRFGEEVCELDWPAPEALPPERPCAGDLLFFEGRDLAQQRWRVVRVRPDGAGWLRVLALAEPEYHLWRGVAADVPPPGPGARARQGLAVVLEKHCGFAADVYSLGMLLLAMLVGRPDVGDFREALPGVQIELEDHLRDGTPLPGRALVQRLVSRPSKHLQVFHSYAQRLAGYGIAQPLAEELLGVVLRATLRGDARVFYLADRGADARPALRRLRADLDAVRGAARNAFTTAQAAAVRDARLAVLDRLRGRVQQRTLEDGPAPRPRTDERLIYPALDLGAADQGHCDSELAYLSPLASQPGAVLDRWEQELSGLATGGSAAGRAWDFLLRYCRVLDPSAGASARFLDSYQELLEKVAQTSLPADVAQAEDREHMRRWLDDHQALAERLRAVSSFVAVHRDFTANLKDKLLKPWDRALRRKVLFVFHRRAVHVPLSRAERAAIRNEDVGAALERLSGAVQESHTAREERGRDFERVLGRWRAWCSGRSWLGAVAGLEADALRQWQALAAAGAAWDEEWTGATGRLRNWLTAIDAVLQAYDALLSTDPPSEEVQVRLTRTRRETLDQREAAEAVAWLEQYWPSPGDRLESLFALWELGLSSSQLQHDRRNTTELT
jgi:hypothetical protein